MSVHLLKLAVGAETLSLVGTGIASNGALRNISGNNSWGGAITLAGAAGQAGGTAGPASAPQARFRSPAGLAFVPGLGIDFRAAAFSEAAALTLRWEPGVSQT